MQFATKVCLTRHGELVAHVWQTNFHFLLVYASTGLCPPRQGTTAGSCTSNCSLEACCCNDCSTTPSSKTVNDWMPMNGMIDGDVDRESILPCAALHGSLYNSGVLVFQQARYA